MATPTTAITRHDLSLTYSEFNEMANRRGFIGLRVLPAVPVLVQAAQFNKIKVASLMGPIEDTVVAPDGAYKFDDFEWAHDSYTTEDHGVAERLGDRRLKMYGEFNAELIHRRRAVNRVLMAFEDAVAAAVFNTGTWTGADLATAVTIPWTNKANATPVDDIDGAIESCKDSSGMKPNALILSDFALRKMKRTAQIEDLLKYSGRDDPKNLGLLSGLRDLFDLEDILVADGFKNTAKRGQTPELGRLWATTMAMVAHVTSSQDLEDPNPTIGRTIMWGEENAALPGAGTSEPGVIVEEYRDEGRRGSVIRARADYQIKILHPAAGHLLTAVTA